MQNREHCDQHLTNAQNLDESNDGNQNDVIILGVHVHCAACEERILKCLRGYDGVEGIEVDSKNNRVTIKGKEADPIKVAERLRRKSGKHVHIISPRDPKKQEKKKEVAVTEVVLKIYLYCQGCVDDVKSEILKMSGVHTAQTDLEQNLVTVKGIIEPEKLAEFVKKKTGKYVEIAKKGNRGHKDDKNVKQGDQQNGNTDLCNNYRPGLVYAPQLFSDENPNSCSVM